MSAMTAQRGFLRVLLSRGAGVAGLVAALGAGALGGCGATTGVDVQVKNADKIKGATALSFAGTVDGAMVSHEVYEPSGAGRTLTALEDLRIVLADNLDGKVLTVTVSGVMGDGAGNPVKIGTPVSGAGVVVANHTKVILVDFMP